MNTIESIRKPLPTIADHQRNPEQGSIIGLRFFVKFANLADSKRNQKYPLIIHLRKKYLNPKDNPYDFEEFLIIKNPTILNGKTYFIGIDNHGRIYFFRNNSLSRVREFISADTNNKKDYLESFYKIFKQQNQGDQKDSCENADDKSKDIVLITSLDNKNENIKQQLKQQLEQLLDHKLREIKKCI
ncbi:MAG: hypothetical protein Fur009_5430 [Candidatus Microgenomates bacterium]